MCMSFFWGCSVQPHLFLYSRVSFRIHFHDLHRINAGTQLKNWSALRHHTTPAGDAYTTNAIKNDSGSTISQMLIRSIFTTNMASPPPRMIPVLVGIW